VTPDDASYTEAIARWARNAERPARVVAFVKDTNDVALALEYARANGLQIAIRGGGHSPSGASSAKDGVVIDLSRHLNYAVVDSEKRTVRVGGGTLWGTVEKEAIQHGLASVAGSVNHVCVSFRLVLHAVLTRRQTGVSGYVLSLQLWSSGLMSNVRQRLLLGGGFGFLTGQHGLVIDNLLQVRPIPAGRHYPPLTTHM
jgi:FAD/FMN-containing dehydrogenase